MNKNILKVGKVLESWVTLDLSHKRKLNMKPSVSYIGSSALNYPPTKNILSTLDGDELVRGVFVAYNLLNGDDDDTALRKAETIYTIDYVKSESDEYYADEECETCEGNGEVNCESCDGVGNVECDECDGSGQISCEDCEGEECSLCNGDEFVKCEECDGDGDYTCNNCGGDGKFDCSECDGSGEVEGNIEKIDIEYGTIITQSAEMIEELNRRTNNRREDAIDGFNEWVSRYKNEILISDRIDDTIEYDYEWEVGDAEAKLEYIRINKLGDYKVGKNNEITSLGTR